MKVAAYARYSSDQQRDASLEDQLRNCRAYCERQGWPEPVPYTDAAASGASTDRAAYQRLMADASLYDVIVVDDLTRLSRDNVEVQTLTRRLTFAKVRLVTVSDGVDTNRKGYKLEVGMRGLMGEMYLDELADKTHRGLMGRALEGASAGGLPYGYEVTSTGHRAIREDQAAIVRRIFAEYLSGMSARSIAAGLNAEGIPSGRGKQWAASAIHGDVRRGIGILANPIYIGRQVWNRSHWVRHPEKKRKRVRQENPRSEWIIRDHPELAIIDAGTWSAVERRLRAQTRTSGTVGRPPVNLLSGILRCGECGGPLVVVDRYRYGCSHAKQKGTCTGITVKREAAEETMVGMLRDELLTEDAYKAAQRVVQAALKPDRAVAARKLAEAQRWHGNVMQAIRAGIITPSTKADLEAAEAAVEAAKRESVQRPATMVPRLRERWERIVRDLDAYRSRPGLARNALIDVIGESVPVRNENGDLVAEVAGSQLALVAGAGYVHGLHQPIRIYLGRA